jgi:hypothetical protein
MRHTAITNLVQAGVDLPTIKRISGHKTLAMVERYAHVHGQHIDQAIRAIGRTLPQPTENETGRTITQELHTPAENAPGGQIANGQKGHFASRGSKLEAGSGIEPLWEDLQSSA